MESRKKRYWTIFRATFQLSAFTFGGGFVIIPLLRKKFVEELRWIEEEEMLDLTAIAQSSPGPVAVNAAILVGYRTAGLPGALVAIAGTVLPPLITISVISFFYAAFRDNRIVSLAMGGLLAGVAAVVLDVVVTLAGGLLRLRRALPLLILLGAFLAVRVFDVHIVPVVLACGLLGALDAHRRRREEGGGK